MKENKHICKQCNKIYVSKGNLKRHIDVKHNNIKYKCTQCDKIYSYKSDLVKHAHVQHLHTFEYKCNICNKTYTSNPNLKRHIDTKHNNIQYECTKCDKIYNNKSTLTKHIERKHNPNFKVHGCKLCDKVYTQKGHLNRHIEEKHNLNFKGYKCLQCDKIYTDRSTLSRHINIKHNPDYKCYKCRLCSKVYTTKGGLVIHNSIKHNSNFIGHKCKICDNIFIQKGGLKNHMEHVHDIGMYKCDFCLGNRNSHISYKDNQSKHKICRKCYNKVTGKTSRVEYKWSDYLDKHVGTEYLTSSDKSLISQGGCQLYRPDKLYIGINLVEIDECDEHQHKWNGPYKCDEARISKIYEEEGICGKTLVVIRWNPDHYKVPNGNKKILREERLQLHVKLKKYLRTNPPKDKITIYYMFYDIDSDRISKNYPFKMIYDENDI